MYGSKMTFLCKMSTFIAAYAYFLCKVFDNAWRLYYYYVVER